MKAIFVTGGKQYYVSEGDTIYVEKLNVEAGETVEFTDVLEKDLARRDFTIVKLKDIDNHILN